MSTAQEVIGVERRTFVRIQANDSVPNWMNANYILYPSRKSGSNAMCTEGHVLSFQCFFRIHIFYVCYDKLCRHTKYK